MTRYVSVAEAALAMVGKQVASVQGDPLEVVVSFMDGSSVAFHLLWTGLWTGIAAEVRPQQTWAPEG